MKAWFILKDGNIVNNLTGYNSEEGAMNSLMKLTNPLYYKLINELYSYRCYGEISDDKKKYYNECTDRKGDKVYIKRVDNDRIVFKRDVVYPYLKEHYQIVEKEFEITFQD